MRHLVTNNLLTSAQFGSETQSDRAKVFRDPIVSGTDGRFCGRNKGLQDGMLLPWCQGQ